LEAQIDAEFPATVKMGIAQDIEDHCGCAHLFGYGCAALDRIDDQRGSQAFALHCFVNGYCANVDYRDIRHAARCQAFGPRLERTAIAPSV
jgi:hypothetical protein